MAWRDELRSLVIDGRKVVGASFRGVTFHSVEAESQFGRRTVVHEYPQRDKPYTEDLGRGARQFVVEGYVIGDDYLAKRDALIAALETAGPGELVHPRYGTLAVAVTGMVSIRESSREGGIARFSITFVEAGDNTFPQASGSTADKVHDAADSCGDAACDVYSGVINVDGAQVLEDDLASQLTAGLSQLREMLSLNGLVDAAADVVRTVSAVSTGISALIRTPVVLAQSIESLYAQLTTAVNRPLSALADLRAQFSSNDIVASVLSTGATASKRQSNQSATRDFFRVLSMASQARILSDAVGTGEIVTAQDARAQADLLLEQIDQELEAHDPPATVAKTLLALRATIVRDVSGRAERLLQRSTTTTTAVLPALLIAQRVYQDATRADEFVSRNGVRHPLFVSAGEHEVLL